MSREDSVRQSAIGGAQFPWLPGEVGEWLVDRFAEWDGGVAADDAGQEELAHVVPAGFPALIRVLHPFTRDRPASGDWAEFESQMQNPAFAHVPELVEESVGWRETASAYGRADACKPAALSWRITGAERYEQLDTLDSEGWRYDEPAEGRLPEDVLECVAAVLTAHTSTPGRGVAAIWEGYGGLLSSQGVGFFAFAPMPRLPARLVGAGMRVYSRLAAFQMRRKSFGIASAIRAVLFPGGPQPLGSGYLSKAAATGSRLELPGRDYVCFSAGIADFRTPRWKARAPWLGPDGYRDNYAQTPNLIWPRGREWLLTSEIDFDSTLISCSRETADALLAAPGIEAVEITRDTALWAEER